VSGYVLSRRAASDLDEIWDYSAEHWGGEQANRYVEALRESIRRAALDPSRGRPVRVGGRSYHRYRSGSHVIFCRIARKKLHVVRILHQSMDHARHLR